MARLDHERPALRYLDNLRRELSKTGSIADHVSNDLNWPPYLRPVAAEPKAIAALFDLLENLTKWCDEDNLSLDSPPDYVKQSYAVFARRRIYHRYDNSYCGREWLENLSEDPDPQARAIAGLLLLILKSA